VAQAITAAGYGDTILLLNGTYTGSATPLSTGGKAILITSYNGLPVTVTFNSAAGTLFNINSGESYDTVIRGLIITGASISAVSAVTVTGSSPTFQNCRFTANAAGDGTAIYLSDSFARIDNCWFDNNAGTYGTAVFAGAANINTASILTVTHSRFQSNQAIGAGGAGVALGNFATLSVSKSFFDLNVAGISGAAIYLSASTDSIKAVNNSFRSNNSPAAAGKSVFCTGATAAKVTASNNIFCGTNTANSVSCSTNWNTPTVGTADNCGVCNGGDLEKDCKSVCFGYSVYDFTGLGCCELTEQDCSGRCDQSYEETNMEHAVQK